MTYADDGFGNMTPTTPEPAAITSVFARVDGQLCRWEVSTDDHQLAINTVKQSIDHGIRPVLAMIEGGRLPSPNRERERA